MYGVAHMMDPVLEILLFRVAGARYGISLGQVVGVVRDLPGESLEGSVEDPQLLLFEGRSVPVFPAEDFLQTVGPGTENPSEAIIFNDGQGLFGMAVDTTESVVGVTPGDDLYSLPPQEPTDRHPCRAWAVLTVSELPIILLDMSRVEVH